MSLIRDRRIGGAPRNDMAAAKKNTKPGYDFIVASLKKDKNASYADIAAAAKKKSLAVYPIMYGRAKAALGLVPSKPRGSKKKKVGRPAGSRGVGRRGPGRPRKNPKPDSLEGILAAVKSSEIDKERYREALEQVQDIIADALAD